MAGAHAAGLPPREADSASASAVKAMQAEGRLRRRASATRNWSRGTSGARRESPSTTCATAAEADEAVQDAFVKAYSHLSSFREELPFEVWFTRILINGCLDRIKARTRRERWLVSCAASRAPGPVGFHGPGRRRRPVARGSGCSRESAGRRLAGALARLPDRQRSVFMLSHYEGCTSREVSALTGLNESTVRVHLFRAIRRLRTLLDRRRHRRGRPRTGGKRRVTS